jgi:ubiquinone/menaquinone biosynthesis C-methylase UbiE
MGLKLDSPLAADLCFAISKKMGFSHDATRDGDRTQNFTDEEYFAWRSDELGQQFDDHFSADLVRGKDCIDFGCGVGDLAFHITRHQPKSVLGLELDPVGVQMANDRLAKETFPVKPEFRASHADHVERPDDSADLILCFDVLEHIMDYRQIITEWKRILRPGGRMGIWWCPWFHPYGPHIESLVPIPWCHVLFSERVLIETCARIYESSDYQPRVWDLDEDGNRLPNKWRNMRELPEVNRLTMNEFEDVCSQVGLRVARRDLYGFGGSTLSRLTRPLIRLPMTREYFASYVIYELEA